MHYNLRYKENSLLEEDDLVSFLVCDMYVCLPSRPGYYAWDVPQSMGCP